MDTVIRREGTLTMALGLNVRPTDPREQKYSFARTTPPLHTVDLSQPRLLSRIGSSDGTVNDYRVPITNQGGIGACACFTTATCAEMSAQLTGRTPTALHPGWLYEVVRRYEGSYPADAGSYLADTCDFAMNGLAPLADHPYVQDAAYDYPAAMDQHRSGQDYVLSHRPFYPSEGQVLENIWTALDQHLPIAIGMLWLSEFFTPTRGILPAGLSAASNNGGHAVTCWGICDGYVLCANSWSSFWASDAATSGLPDMRPGDFAIPWDYLTRPAPVVFELRAVAAEPAAAPPAPTYDPNTLAWIQWQNTVASYVEQTYAAGDLATASAWEATLVQYVPYINGLMQGVGTAAAVPDLPAAVGL